MAQKGQYLIDSEEKATQLAKKACEDVVKILSSIKLEDLKLYLEDNQKYNIEQVINYFQSNLNNTLYKRRLIITNDTELTKNLINSTNYAISEMLKISTNPQIKNNEVLTKYFKGIASKLQPSKELFTGAYNILSKKDFNASKPNEDAAKNSSTSKEEVLKLLKSNFGKIQNMDGQFGKYESYINALDNSNPHKAKLKAFCDYYRNGLVRKLYWALENTISQTEKQESNFLSESVKLFNYYVAQLTAPYPEDIKFAKPTDLNGITAYVGSFISQVQPSLTQLASKFKNG